MVLHPGVLYLRRNHYLTHDTIAEESDKVQAGDKIAEQADKKAQVRILPDGEASRCIHHQLCRWHCSCNHRYQYIHWRMFRSHIQMCLASHRDGNNDKPEKGIIGVIKTTLYQSLCHLALSLWVCVVSAGVLVAAVKAGVGLSHGDGERLDRLDLVWPLL